MTSRKKFIKQVLKASASAVMIGIHSSRSMELVGRPEYRCFDLHTHPGVFFRRGTPGFAGDDEVVTRVKEMLSQGMSGGFFSLVSDLPLIKLTEKGVEITDKYEKGEGIAEYHRQLKQFLELCKIAPIHLATKSRELMQEKKGKITAYLACEGGDHIEHTDQLEEMYADGVRLIQLVHYAPNDLGDLQTHAPIHQGLTDLGRSVVKKMNELGILVDVAHASAETVKAVAKTSSVPFILSHSLLNVGNDRPISARTITGEHARWVAESGGVIGAWPSGYNRSFEDFIDNIMRLIDTVGVDHVGLGTDMDSNFKPVMNRYSQLPEWTSALRAKGMSHDEVQKVAGGNAQRVIKAVLRN